LNMFSFVYSHYYNTFSFDLLNILANYLYYRLSDGSTIDTDDQDICSSTMASWENNWLFQKKKVNRMSGSNNYYHHPVPVPMLVPNPSEVTRPLIGDRDADETSELSDYSNSALDELLEFCNDIIIIIIITCECSVLV